MEFFVSSNKYASQFVRGRWADKINKMTGIVLEKWNICEWNVWLWIRESDGIFNLTQDSLPSSVSEHSKREDEGTSADRGHGQLLRQINNFPSIPSICMTIKFPVIARLGTRRSRNWRKSDQKERNVWVFSVSKISNLIKCHFSVSSYSKGKLSDSDSGYFHRIRGFFLIPSLVLSRRKRVRNAQGDTNMSRSSQINF